MNIQELDQILEKHYLWLDRDEKNGERADLRYADLSGLDLRNMNLRQVDLTYTDLESADLKSAHMESADLAGSNLSHATFKDAFLQNAILKNIIMVCSNFTYATMRGADFENANFGKAYLTGADISQTKGILSQIEFMKQNFEKTEEGYVAYKTFNTMYSSPKIWETKEGNIITETVNFDRTETCGCGINAAPFEWVKMHCDYREIWKVLIRWEYLAGICVPYDSSGKIRCEKVESSEVVKNV